MYYSEYLSPLGLLSIAADGLGLTELCFASGQNERRAHGHTDANTVPVINQTKRWLDIYFGGKEPGFMPPVHMTGTPFRMEVWNILRTIPYGETVTYGDIAKEIAKRRGLKKMSAQAIGGAVGHNKIGIIIPCHRVVGANFDLVGYAAGLDRKILLLEYEGVNTEKFLRFGRARSTRQDYE